MSSSDWTGLAIKGLGQNSTEPCAESALRDLEALAEWYLDQGLPEVAERLVAEVFERVQALEVHPNLGRVVPEFGQGFLREIIHPPLRIVYRREAERVRVVRVWRSERLLRLAPEG